MSRCFPYPPVGYVKKGIADEALIEQQQQQQPVKFQEEAEKAKKEKKREKKREKKEKKVRENGLIEVKKQDHKIGNKDERQPADEHKELGKKREREAENVDRITKSTITDDHPVGSQNSSDSTLNSDNSNKRQKLNLSPEGKQNTGNILRIRLPIQKHGDHEVLPREQMPSRLPPYISAPVAQSPRLPLQKTEVSPSLRETLPGRPIQNNRGERTFRSTVQRVDTHEAPKEMLPNRLSIQRNKDSVIVVKGEQPRRLTGQSTKRPEVFSKEEQPCGLPLRTHKEPSLPAQDRQPSLKRQRGQEALLKEKKACLVSLQRTKDLEVLPRDKQQPNQLPIQTSKDREVVPKDKQLSQFPIPKDQKVQDALSKEKKASQIFLQRTKDPEELPRYKQQPSQLPVQTNKDRKVIPKEAQLSQLPLQKNKDQVLPKEHKRTQLPIQKQIVPPVREEQSCFLAGRIADASVQGRSEPVAVEKPCSTSTVECKQEKKSRRRASQYKELLEKWVQPPLFPSLLPTDDEEGWFITTNKNQNSTIQKPVAADQSLSCGDSVSWPRAQLLPQVDLYALPYTVPL